MPRVPDTSGVFVALNMPAFEPQPPSGHRDETGFGLVKAGVKISCEKHVCGEDQTSKQATV